ncbi:MAG TPA: carboxypeptidase-like regulatory domain-containing protein [Edaphobacter sp.]|nr:carboxypeptidase-like regulatory domain-containing protein [Edaphobacter sp.]
MRRPGSVLPAVWLLAAAGVFSQAQSPGVRRDAEVPAGVATARLLPDAPEVHAAEVTGGAICGTVLDVNGAEVTGASVMLKGGNGKDQRDATTDDNGFFRFSSVAPGSFKVSVMATGFSNWSSGGLTLLPNEDYDLPPVELKVATSTTEVAVVFTRWDMAEEEMRAEEKQRVLGAIPNFYVSYSRDPEPLSSGQKYRLAWKMSVDPVSIGLSAGIAGVEQSQNAFSGYGQGVRGYAKRFGAVYGDGAIATFLADAVFPSVLHQDPRYFYKGTGRIASRALYAIASVVICKGDNGRWQPNYSNVLGDLAAAGISNLYYPASDRDGAELTIRNSLIGTAGGAVGNLFQEFLIKRISRGVEP